MNTPATDVFARIRELGIVAVLTLERVEDAVPVADALLAGGVGAIELTLRTPVAFDCIRTIRERVPSLLLGVGTILNPDAVRQVVDSGATFGVSPGCNPRVLETARSLNLPFGPGVCTPSDIERALEFDCKFLKFFPAEPSGGLPFLKVMAAPYAHLGVEFIPLGGISESNMTSYLQAPEIAAVGGSWLAPAKVIREKRWAEIEATARRATAIRDSARG
jgi:2-dehydro-3-deoxyphosphogluconate aldolase / (4S)-4-hydroxy-2-oxoglutarate aldolase